MSRGADLRGVDLLTEVVSSGPRSSWFDTAVRTCCRDTGGAGAGLLVADARGPAGLAAATAGMGQVGEDLQYALGEGPSWSAVADGDVVSAPDLTGDERWWHFAREATAVGIAATMSVPLVVAAQRVGVLSVYWCAAGAVSERAASAVLDHAAACTALLVLVHEAEEGGLPDVVDIRPVVHQATGMISAHLDVDPAEALLRVRAHAYAEDMSPWEVADMVVRRELVFDPAGTARRTSTKDGHDDRT